MYPVQWLAKFWARVDKHGPIMPGMKDRCWLWTGSSNGRSGSGYGSVSLPGGETALAHRVSLELALGRAIKHGLSALHSCDNKKCVNPRHLREGSQRENVIEGLRQRDLKLDDAQLAEIRRLYEDGFSQYEIANHYAVNQSHISRVIRGVRRESPQSTVCEIDGCTNQAAWLAFTITPSGWVMRRNFKVCLEHGQEDYKRRIAAERFARRAWFSPNEAWGFPVIWE